MDNLEIIQGFVELGAAAVVAIIVARYLYLLGREVIDRVYKSFLELNKTIDNLGKAIERGNVVDERTEETLRENTKVISEWTAAATEAFVRIQKKIDRTEDTQTRMDGKLAEVVKALADIAQAIKKHDEEISKSLRDVADMLAKVAEPQTDTKSEEKKE